MSGKGSIAPLLILVAIMGVLAAALIVVACVVWLSCYFGSLIAPCLLVAAVLLLIAFIIYHIGLKERMREWEERTEVIYEVMNLLREGYTFVARFFARSGE